MAGRRHTDLTILKNSMAHSEKTKHSLTMQPSSCIPGHLSQKNENLSMQKPAQDCHGNFTYDSLKCENRNAPRNELSSSASCGSRGLCSMAAPYEEPTVGMLSHLDGSQASCAERKS